MVNFALMYPLMEPSLLRPHPAKSATPLSKNNARPKRSRYDIYIFIIVLRNEFQDDTTTKSNYQVLYASLDTKKL